MLKIIPSVVLSLCAIAGSTAIAGEVPAKATPAQVQGTDKPDQAAEETKAALASVLANPELKATSKALIERVPTTNKERMFLARAIVGRHLAPDAPAPLEGKDRALAKKRVIQLMDEAQNKEESREALEMAVQLFTSDSLGFKDDKKAVKLLEAAVENGIPFAAADLATAYAQGALGLKQDTAKALELVNREQGRRNANVLAFKATLLADPSSAKTFDLEAAIATARMAYNLDQKDEMIVSLLSGLLIANRSNEAHVKEGHELLTQWTHRVREIEAQENRELATRAVTLSLERTAPVIHPVDENKAQESAK